MDGYCREFTIDNARNERCCKARVFRSELPDNRTLSRPPNHEAVPTASSLSTGYDLIFRHTHLKCGNEDNLKVSISTQTNVCDC